MRSIFTASRQELPRVLLHVPVGVIGGFLYFAHPVLALTFLGMFALYEVDEAKYIKSEPYIDLKGCLWGLGFFGVVVGILKLAGAI